MDFCKLSPQETVNFFTDCKWGQVYEDDKYFEDAELMDNFIVFFTYVFAWLNLPRPTRGQYAIALWLQDSSNPHRMVWASRGLGKSLASQIYAVWRFLNDPNEKILVMSAGATRAINYTQFVQKLIKMLPVTKDMTPRHNVERTSGQSFDVAGSTASDSPSMYAVGAGNQVTGMRASLVIYDDIETAQTVESMTMMDKIDTFAKEAQNLLMSGKDESICLSTPHSMSSMYIGWLDAGYKLLALPAEVPEDDSAYFGSLAPHIAEMMAEGLIGMAVDERLDKEFLMSKKMRIGKSKYKLQYMLDVSDADDMRYPLKLSDLIVMDIDNDVAPLKISHSTMPENNLYIKHNGFKADKLYAPSYVSKEVAEYEMKLLSLDPSGKGKDEIGVSLIFSLNTRLFLKKITGLQGGYEDDNMIAIATLCRDYGIDTLLIEENWGGGMFTKLLEPHLRMISPKTEIDEVNVKGQKEVRIIENLEPLVNQHKLIIDKDTLDKDKMANAVNSFTYQFSKITKERDSLRADDRLDSLANGVIYMIDKMSDDEEFGMERHKEAEGEDNLAFTLATFDQYGVGTSNYGDKF